MVRVPALWRIFTPCFRRDRTSDQHYGWLLKPPTAEVSEYDDDSALTEYVWRHYSHLLSAAEARAGIYNPPMDRETAVRLKGRAFADYLDRTYGPVEVADLNAELQHGRVALYKRARDRILREHSDIVFVNRCPACNRMVRSPGAPTVLVVQTRLAFGRGFRRPVAGLVDSGRHHAANTKSIRRSRTARIARASGPEPSNCQLPIYGVGEDCQIRIPIWPRLRL